MSSESAEQPQLIWSCPVCKGGLTLLDKTLTCAAGHSFDRAKQGYYNLLLANQKGSANPGDDAAMLGSRREFLAAGHFAPLAQTLGNTLVDLTGNCEAEDFQLLDTGCGEGYYLAELQQRLHNERPAQTIGYAGSDISKEAAKLAARLHKDIDWCVASSFNLPVDNRSVDVVMRVFAPGDLEEVARVLKPGGHFLRVVPGAEHLLQLKDALYDEVTLHELQPTPEGFSELSATEIRFDVELNDHASVQQLLNMTPFMWRGKREAREALQQAEYLKVGAHFVVQLYRLEEAPALPVNTPAPSIELLKAKQELKQEKHAEKLKKQAEKEAAKLEQERLAKVAQEKAAAFNWGSSAKAASNSDVSAAQSNSEKQEEPDQQQPDNATSTEAAGVEVDSVPTTDPLDDKAPAVEVKTSASKVAFSFAARKADEGSAAERQQEIELEKQTDEDVSSFLDEFVARKEPGSAAQERASSTVNQAVSETTEPVEETAKEKAAKKKPSNKGFSF